jgi:putative transposase
VLVALGVRENGEKVLLSLMTAGAESADGWQLLLDDLAARKMGRPRLVISDGNTGLAAALDRLWSGLPHQRCTVHKLRNLIAKTPKHAQEAVREGYITASFTPRLWRRRRKHAKRSWQNGRNCVLAWRLLWKKPGRTC